MSPATKPRRKSKRPSGVTMTTNRNGTITLRAYGPSAPDLRDVVPGLFAGTRCSACGSPDHKASDAIRVEDNS